MLVDATSLDSGWTRSRPTDKLSTRPQNGEAKPGLEALDGRPISFENAERVSDLEAILVELDSRLDEEQPDGNVEERQHCEQVRNLAQFSGDEGRNNCASGHESGSDNCVSSDAWSNDVHSAYYPSEINGSHKKCEETK
jgi:hypothetical protein